jgi:hypothetical protein
MGMDPGLIDWLGILTKLGLQTPAIIMGIMLWWAMRDRKQSEERQRFERDRYEDELRDIIREQIDTNKNTSSALSTLVSLLGSPRKGRG